MGVLWKFGTQLNGQPPYKSMAFVYVKYIGFYCQ